MNLTISIDDVNPNKDWRILGDKTEKYLFDLNKIYGAKFNLFIPSNFHNSGKLSKNKQWIKELNECGLFELSAHGHFHDTSDRSKYGQMEFFDISEIECIERLKLIEEEWSSVDVKPNGWRNPGWMCQPYCVKHISKQFKWAALHYEHNKGYEWDCDMIFGADGIHEDKISLHNESIMFQSHIFGSWNANEWNDKNFDKIKLNLEFLVNKYKVNFTTISSL
jgi:peptidoglycan/xylan/chitin deacetylase (PgdA/CDA1 family)